VIYLDNAATTWPKPPAVYDAMDRFARTGAANPGRSGHRMAVEAERLVQDARERVARLLNAASPDRVILTLNATDALNIAMKGLLRAGDHVVTSAIEHNSINRPLAGLEAAGTITVSKVACSPDGTIAPREIDRLVTKATRLIAITHCSNVLGVVQPLDEFCAIAKKRGVAILVDASQTAGVVPIDVRALGADMVAFPGHKGCFGPMGTGALYVRPGLALAAFREGGTGFAAESERHPEEYPYHLEGGTPNAHGLVGLGAGLRFIEETGIDRIRVHERDLAMRLVDALRGHPKITIFSGRAPDRQIGPVSIAIAGVDPSAAGATLDATYGIACRPGLHCAPGAHQFLGTHPQGTVRFSFGFFNTAADVEAAARAVKEIAA
jgi:cysteine desulfurase family protein